MDELIEEAKRRFPIGCSYYHVGSSAPVRILLLDNKTYTICNGGIMAHSGGGYLYQDHNWAELISSPELINNNYLNF